MQDKKPMRFNDGELSTLKSIFADNEPMLLLVRKFLQGAELSVTEMSGLTTLSDEAKAVIRKVVLPVIEFDAPLFQATDLWVNINTKEQSIEKSYVDMLAREITEDYLVAQFDILNGKKVKNIDLLTLHKLKGKDPEKAVVDLMARNTILSHIDFQLYQAKVLAGRKEESVEETQNRLAKDSAK